MRKTIIYVFVFVMLGISGCGQSGQPRQQSAPPNGASILKTKADELPGRIVMGWNAFGTTASYLQQNSVAREMNVVSPRWFSLDAQRLVTGEADQEYITWAHQSGKQVWAFFGNQFNAELTDSLIGKKDDRNKIVKLLMDKMVAAQIDGINVDFQNINPKNRDDFVDLVKQLKKALSGHGMVVSVDVTRENPDPFWSASYNRKELGKEADYIILMGYDEDLGGGEKVGSVASLPWVEEGLQLLLKDVPAQKIILGMPFYTREWVTNHQTNQRNRFDRSMLEAEQLAMEKRLTKQWDADTRQNYVEFAENGERHQIWFEDEMSLRQRLDLVNRYQLKGAAVWFVGQEKVEIWSVFR